MKMYATKKVTQKIWLEWFFCDLHEIMYLIIVVADILS